MIQNADWGRQRTDIREQMSEDIESSKLNQLINIFFYTRNGLTDSSPPTGPRRFFALIKKGEPICYSKEK